MKAPAFLLFVRDWLCSRTVLAMSGDAVKAYMYLLCEAWLQKPRATLPNDDSELASMARVTKEKWMSLKSEIDKVFKIGTCEEHQGRLYNERLLEASRTSEAKQRFGKSNAKVTQNERKAHAGLEDEYEYEKNLNPEEEGCKGETKEPDFFETFWTVYPKKKAKGDAEKAWRKIKPQKEILVKIINALEWQKKTTDWIKDSGQYIPYPASYLRAKGWEDEPPQQTEFGEFV